MPEMQAGLQAAQGAEAQEMIEHEHHEQVTLFDWAKRHESTTPELKLLYANPLGGKRPLGTAKKMKAEGVKKGVPDLTLPVPVGGYHGLYLEMKWGRNKPTDNQQWWLDQLRSQGYATHVAYSFEEARDCILQYLAGCL
jgi:hypothetical protein